MSMWHILCPAVCISHMVPWIKKHIGQVEVKNEFNQAHLRLIDIYHSLNSITGDFHLAHAITAVACHFSASLGITSLS